MPKTTVDKKMVLEAAIELIDEQGLESLTCKAVTDRLDIKPPSLFNHVKNLDELLVELSITGLRTLRHELAESSIGKSGKSALLEMSGAYYDFATAHPGLYSAIQWSNKSGNPSNEEAINSIKLLLDKVLGNGFFENEESVHMFRIIRSMIHGFALLGSHDRFDASHPLKESFDYGTKILVKDLRNLE